MMRGPRSTLGAPPYCVRKIGRGGKAYWYYARGDYRAALPDIKDPTFTRRYETAHEDYENRPTDDKSFVIMQRNELDQFFASYTRAAKARARKSGLVFELSKHWCSDEYVRVGGRCALTGLTMRKPQTRWDHFGPSLDRIDSGGGYTPENCQLVLLCVNLGKRDMSHAAFVGMCRSVMMHQNRTNREQSENVGNFTGEV